MKESIKVAGMPHAIVTDGWNAYIHAVRPLRGVKHVIAHFERKLARVKDRTVALSNNLIERFNSTFKQKYHSMRGFKSLKKAQEFLDGFLFYYNYLRYHMTLGSTPAEKSHITGIGWKDLPRIL